MSDATCVPARIDGEPQHITPRAAWRDAIKADPDMGMAAKFLGLLMADYWSDKYSTPVLYLTNEVAESTMHASRNTVMRARAELARAKDAGASFREIAARTGGRWTATGVKRVTDKEE